MFEKIQSGVQAIVMYPKDHLATSLRKVAKGEQINFTHEKQWVTLTLQDEIPFGHKFALIHIPAGTEVRKYGEVIGRAVQDIAQGMHVHVHNIEGIRGRGDQIKMEELE